MKEIFSSKGHMISKLVVYQIAMSLLGLFVVSPFNGNMQIYASVFATLFYFSLVSYAVIEDGQKDCISHKAGRIKGNPLTGLVYSLISYIPTILVVLIQVILQLATKLGTFSAVKVVLNFAIRFFLMGTYLGFDSGLVQRLYDTELQASVVRAGTPELLVFLSDNYLIFAICLIFLPAVCAIAYYLAFIGKVHVDTSTKKEK